MQDIRLHEQITAIDPDNVGTSWPVDKLEAHVGNIPHLAISIFVFRGRKLLLQQRAPTKYHSGGLWANTVCSHPRWLEDTGSCARRRLVEELGWHTPLFPFGKIHYTARVGELYENEYVSLFVGQVDDTELDEHNRFDQREVAALQWLEIPQIMRLMAQAPERFCEWFKIYMSTYQHMILDQLELLNNRPEVK